MTLRAIEFFSGVGGWRYALGNRGEVAAAFDIHPGANATYELNHHHRPLTRDLSSLGADALQAHRADTWMMSPPCQPFCRMGNKADIEDSRSLAFLNLMKLLEEAPPERLVMENVVGFLGSRAHALLLERFQSHGFHHQEFTLCPSRFGLPNQRPRVYLAAARRALPTLPLPDLPPPPLQEFLDQEEDQSLYLSETEMRHKPGLDLVRAHDRRSACFIGGYGQRFMGSGSFLVTEKGIRRFSPLETARLLGYPDTFHFPADLSLAQRYKLLGNGLSLPVARWVMDLTLG